MKLGAGNIEHKIVMVIFWNGKKHNTVEALLAPNVVREHLQLQPPS